MPFDLIPKDKCKEWLLTAFKIYILSGYVVWKLCNLYISGSDSSYIPSSYVTTGYILCLSILTFVAGVRYGRRQNKEALNLLIFILLGAIFIVVNFKGVPLWEWTIPVTEILANGLVFWLALAAYQRFKARALTFWIWACAINIVREVGLGFCDFLSGHQATDSWIWQLLKEFPTGDFTEFYWIGGFVSSVLYVAGIILAVCQLRSKETFNPSPNTAMLVALGGLILIIELAVSLSEFRKPDFLPVTTVNLVVILVAVLAIPKYQLAFLCLALAGVFTIGRTVGLDFYPGWSYPARGFEQGILELLSTIGIMASVLWATATILVIRRAFVRRCHESLAATPD